MNEGEIGIIGFGRFGMLMAKHLKKKFRVFVSDALDKSSDAKVRGVNFTTIEECAKKEIVILAVPISEFGKTLDRIAPFLKKGALVMDVCSVKEMPVKAMAEKLPQDVECAGTHPLFGPDSAKNGLKGLKIVLCPVRTGKLKKIERFLQSIGLETITASPEEHDKQMGKSQLMLHFIGNALFGIGANEVEMATPNHAKLMEVAGAVKNNSGLLFRDMNRFNRFAAGARRELINELARLDAAIGENNVGVVKK